jgi:acyl carrier protein
MMDAAEIELKLRNLLSDQLGVGPEITRTCRLRADLGADSLDETEIGVAIDEQFGIEFTDDEPGRDRTVGELVDLISDLIDERERGAA